MSGSEGNGHGALRLRGFFVRIVRSGALYTLDRIFDNHKAPRWPRGNIKRHDTPRRSKAENITCTVIWRLTFDNLLDLKVALNSMDKSSTPTSSYCICPSCSTMERPQLGLWLTTAKSRVVSRRCDRRHRKCLRDSIRIDECLDD